MMVDDWSVPVRIVKDDGEVIEVQSTRVAADILVTRWPGKWGSQKHLAAQAACLEVIQGKADPDRARNAFEEAVREADILAD